MTDPNTLPAIRAGLPIVFAWFDHAISCSGRLEPIDAAPPHIAVAEGILRQFAGDAAGARQRFAAVWDKLGLTPADGDDLAQLPPVEPTAPWIAIAFTAPDSCVAGVQASTLLLPQQAYIMAALCGAMTQRDLLGPADGPRILPAGRMPTRLQRR